MLDMLPTPKETVPRKIPNYQLFLSAQNAYVSRAWKAIYDTTGNITSGVSFLMYILGLMDIDYMKDQVNNYDRYSYHLRHIRTDILPSIRTVNQGKPYQRLFLYSESFYTEEYLLPIDDANTLVYLPLHTDSWNVWKKIRPLRLWTHDSEEFTVQLKNDRLRFKVYPPGYAVLLLDVVALLFKYYFWYTQKKTDEIVNPPQYFIHKFVLCDLLWDNENIWLLSVLNKILDMEDIRDVRVLKSQNLTLDPTWGKIAVNCTKGFEQYWYLTKGVKGNLKPDALIAAKCLANGSLRDRILLLQTRLTFPPLRQYRYLNWLKDKDTLKMYLKILSLKQTTETKGIFRRYLREMNRIIATKPWNACKNLSLQYQIEGEIEDLMAWASAYG